MDNLQSTIHRKQRGTKAEEASGKGSFGTQRLPCWKPGLVTSRL